MSPTGFTYQWLRNGVAISGATLSSYTPVAADVAASLKVRVTPTKPGYIGTFTDSAATSVVVKGDLTFTTAPTITVGATNLQASPPSR